MNKLLSMFTLICSYLIFTSQVLSQPSKGSMYKETNIDKWCHAIINLEVRNFSDEVRATEQELRSRLIRQEISQHEYESSIKTLEESQGTYTGTAILLVHNNRHYILTARHVVEQENYQGEKFILADKLFIIKNGSEVDEKGKYTPKSHYELISYHSSPYTSDENKPFIFSSKEDDLAVIFILPGLLEGGGFWENLMKKGYNPIGLDDIDPGCQLKKGQELTAFGFPGDISMLQPQIPHQAQRNWSSSLVSLPVVSRGSVNDPHLGKNFFSGGIFVSPGSSGGAVVSKNKLVGIVSRQTTTVEKVSSPSLNYYISRDLEFGKSSVLVSLISKLEEKIIEKGF